MNKHLVKFLVRWLANCGGLYLAAHYFNLVNYQDRLLYVVLAGLVLALLNAIIKPILVILTLPAIALSLGIFMVVINGFIVYLATVLYTTLKVESFWSAVLVGILIGLLNYIITIAAEALRD